MGGQKEKGGSYGYSSEKGGSKGSSKGDRKGGKASEKGKGGKSSQKLVSQGLRGVIISFLRDKPSGFIQRLDGERDVFFDLVDVIGDEELERHDNVEFDIVEGSDGKYYAARVKKLPKDTPMPTPKSPAKNGVGMTAAAVGSLTGGLGLTPAKKGSLTGGLLGGGFQAATSLLDGSRKSGLAKLQESDEEDEECEGVEWGRIVDVRERFGFLKKLGTSEDAEVFFRAADVVGLGHTDPGDSGMEINLPYGRITNGVNKFFLERDDEVSFVMSSNAGKPCATDIRKERKGAWRTGRRANLGNLTTKTETIKDQVNRLIEMETDQVFFNSSLLKEILEHPQFDPSHLTKIVLLLGSKAIVEDDRADTLYKIFLESSAMQGMLRSVIIAHSYGKHSGNFLESCLRCLVEAVVHHPHPTESLRGILPLADLVEAYEASLRVGARTGTGSSSSSGGRQAATGLTEEIKDMFLTLQRKVPDDINLDRLFGIRAKRGVRSAAEDYTELMEADDYQAMPILPTSAEMLGQCAFELESNMRTYERCEDFLQTHFMLLREDYIEPLRTGIRLFLDGKHSPKDLHVYGGVRVVGMLSTFEGIVYRIEFPKRHLKRVNWEKSKQLMYGSLLCFSDDGFDSLIWATVWRKDPELLASKGQLDIRLPLMSVDDRLSPGKDFCCIENVTIYFEAYRHVLVALQNMRPQDLPFKSILLSPQPQSIYPTFLTADNDMFHFHNVFNKCEREPGVIAPRSFNILQEWPSSLSSALDIDPSQLDAIRHALTHAIGLIQGPPGTGKTWVGLKIVQALLDNTSMSRHSPILVVCYTNHALDQFLEGIFKYCERIARIGSRSKSEVMKNRNLKELVMELQPTKEYFHARKSLQDRRDQLRKELAGILKTLDSHVLSLQSGREVLSDRHFQAFYEGYLEHLGDGAKKVTSKYAGADGVDGELWTKMLQAWLDTKHLEKLAPVENISNTGPLLKGALNASMEDSDDDEEPEEEEVEAEQEQHERRLDVEQPPDKKSAAADFFAELSKPWLEWLDGGSEAVKPSAWQAQADDLWDLSKSERRSAYRQWLLLQHLTAREDLPGVARLLERNAESRAALERDRKLELLREMQIVGMTTTAVSKFQTLLRELRPEIVVVEEAAEVLESHILTALHASTQHVVLIGDHQQLRPSTAVYRLSKFFHLDVSLFERLIKNKADHVTLLQQRRMHPAISRLIKPIYPALRDHESTTSRQEVKGVEKRTFFLRHTYLEDDEGEGHSKSNSFEATFVAALCAHLVRSGYKEEQITVLSPYLGQVRTLKKTIRQDPTTQGVFVAAVDNYQGEENDIVVLSLVRSNRAKSIGFLGVENRINVALTRARCGLYIVGNSDMLRSHPLWSSIINELASDGCFGSSMKLTDAEGSGHVEVRSGEDIEVLCGGADPAAVAAKQRFAKLGGGDYWDRTALPQYSKDRRSAQEAGPPPVSAAAVFKERAERAEKQQAQRETVRKVDTEAFEGLERVQGKQDRELEAQPAKQGGKKKQKNNKVVLKCG